MYEYALPVTALFIFAVIGVVAALSSRRRVHGTNRLGTIVAMEVRPGLLTPNLVIASGYHPTTPMSSRSLPEVADGGPTLVAHGIPLDARVMGRWRSPSPPSRLEPYYPDGAEGKPTYCAYTPNPANATAGAASTLAVASSPPSPVCFSRALKAEDA